MLVNYSADGAVEQNSNFRKTKRDVSILNTTHTIVSVRTNGPHTKSGTHWLLPLKYSHPLERNTLEGVTGIRLLGNNRAERHVIRNHKDSRIENPGKNLFVWK